MTVTEASLTVLGAMVVVVVVVAALEVRTPSPRRRSTRLAFPRVIEGSLDDLPLVDFAQDLHPVALTPMPAPVGNHDSADGAVTDPVEEVEESVVELEEVEEPVTELVPVLQMMDWAREVEEPLTELVPVVRMMDWAREGVEALASSEESDREWDSEDVGPPTEPVVMVNLLDGSDVVEPVESSQVPVSGALDTDQDDGRVAATTIWVASIDRPGGAVVQLGEPGSDRELAGVLFAAYVAGRGAERSRVTGWVTAKGTPGSQPSIEPAMNLRGRPARVRDLLACTDEGRNWVTLNQSVDIARGVRHRPPVDPVLVGLLRWWSAATEPAAQVLADDVGELCAGIESVLDEVEGNPSEPTVRGVLKLARTAYVEGCGLRVESLSRQGHDARAARADESDGRELEPPAEGLQGDAVAELDGSVEGRLVASNG
jgi:hypothetical protein